MCSFIFILIRAVTNEVKTAHVAYWIEQHVTRNHFTYRLVNTASLWFQDHTAFMFCVECYEYVIEGEFPDIHDSCLAELRRLDQLEAELDTWEEQDEETLLYPEVSEESYDEEDEYDYPEDPYKENRCPDCGYSPCDCREEDPLKGDVEPTGGYPEESYLAPTGYGTFERVYYDPYDSSTWPFAPDEWDDEEN